ATSVRPTLAAAAGSASSSTRGPIGLLSAGWSSRRFATWRTPPWRPSCRQVARRLVPRPEPSRRESDGRAPRGHEGGGEGGADQHIRADRTVRGPRDVDVAGGGGAGEERRAAAAGDRVAEGMSGQRHEDERDR